MNAARRLPARSKQRIPLPASPRPDFGATRPRRVASRGRRPHVLLHILHKTHPTALGTSYSESTHQEESDCGIGTAISGFYLSQYRVQWFGEDLCMPIGPQQLVRTPHVQKQAGWRGNIMIGKPMQKESEMVTA